MVWSEKTGAIEPSVFQFKITYVGSQLSVIESIGFANGTFNLNLFKPFETPGIDYGNDDAALRNFSINLEEVTRIINSSEPYMIIEEDTYISFMIWNGSAVKEAILNRTSALDLLNKLINTLDASNTEGISAIRNMVRVLIIPPFILSPENKTYYTTSIPLNFIIDEKMSWIAYSLDNKPNVTITGNTTLTGLAYDSHKIIIYANDTAGNMYSDIVYFTICTCSAWKRKNLLCCPYTRSPSSLFVRTCNPKGCAIEETCMKVSACAL